MQHRHLTTQEWILMAIESLFDRGQLEDWREFAAALRADAALAERTLRVCDLSQARWRRGHRPRPDFRSFAGAKPCIIFLPDPGNHSTCFFRFFRRPPRPHPADPLANAMPGSLWSRSNRCLRR